MDLFPYKEGEELEDLMNQMRTNVFNYIAENRFSLN